MLHLHHLPVHVRGSLHHLHSSSMSHTERPLSMHAEPFLFRVAFLAPRLPANMYGQAALSFLPCMPRSSVSISVSSTHPVHVVRRRTHWPFAGQVVTRLLHPICTIIILDREYSLDSDISSSKYFFLRKGAAAPVVLRG
jgi:hypothetical protein